MKNIFVLIFLVVISCMSFAYELVAFSVQGRTITVRQFGPSDCDSAIVLIGGIHGQYEKNTVELMEEFAKFFQNNRPNVTVYIIENMNPDSFFVDTFLRNDHPTGWINGNRVGRAWTRFNANYVDMNRNWDTASWKSDVRYHGGDFRVGAGGSVSMSEPEVAGVAAFLLEKNEQHSKLLVINYHSYSFVQTTKGMAQPSYTGHWQNPEVNVLADQFALLYSQIAGNYEYLQKWTRYEVPGEFLHWAGNNDISAIDIELPNENSVHFVNSWRDTHYNQNLRAVLEILKKF